jgi:chemotaxis protein MotB
MRRDFDRESQNTDRWLVSYADFITLLFAFFVVMYSISQVNEGKFKILSETLVDAFVQPERSLQPIQVGEVNRTDVESSGDVVYPSDYFGEPATPESERAFEEIREEFATNLQQLIEEDSVKMRSNEHWFALEIYEDDMLFPSGGDQMSESGRILIQSIAETLNKDGIDNEIQIRGYTDDIPIQNRRYSSNWSLSSARAVTVLELMQNAGISPERMVPMGFGEHQPVAPNDTPEGRALNRRIVIQMSKYPRALSELERAAIEDATQELQGTTLPPVTNTTPDSGTVTPTTGTAANQPATNTPSNSTTNNAASQSSNVRLIRAPDGTLVFRAANDSDDDTDEDEDDGSN